MSEELDGKQEATPLQKIITLIEGGLYSSIEISDFPHDYVRSAIDEDTIAGTYDAYCIWCKRMTPFKLSAGYKAPRGMPGGSGLRKKGMGIYVLSASCQRVNMHIYSSVVLLGTTKALKIGQYPSYASLTHAELRPIDKTLESLDRSELGTALGLFAHEAAIGAFVYLRRVFERMIARAHERYVAAEGQLEGYEAMRMNDRVEALKSELPTRLVEASKVFSILSLGIHELSEELCRKYFPPIKAVIFEMLEEEQHKRDATLRKAETDKALAAILTDPYGEIEKA